MTKLVILEYPDPRLRTKAEPVSTVDDALRQFVDDLLETMYAAQRRRSGRDSGGRSQASGRDRRERWAE